MICDGIERAGSSPAPDADIEKLRSEIDRLDDELLELIEKRFQTCIAIGRLKSSDTPDQLLLRPQRERQIVERLRKRARDLPGEAVNAIWREVMGVGLQAQRATALVLYSRGRPELVTSAARTRFGCLAPIIIVGSPLDALQRARNGDAIAIIELCPLSSWWATLKEDPGLKIFDTLSDDGVSVAAVAVGRVPRASMPNSADAEGDPKFEILTDGALRRRLANGEDVRLLAFCGELRLCAVPAAKAAATAKRPRTRPGPAK